MNDKTRDLLKIHISVLLFGLTGVFGKFITLPAVYIVLGRVFFASTAILMLYRLRGARLQLDSRRDSAVLCAIGAILAVHWTSFYQSIQVSTVAIGVLTFSAYPIFVTFAEPLMFHEKLKLADILSSVLIFVGVMLIVPAFSFSNSLTIGFLWGMLSSVTYAVMSLLTRKYASSYPGTLIAFYEQGTATILLLPLLLLRPLPAVGAVNWALLVLLGVVFTACAHSLFIGGLRTVRAQTAGVIASLESVYGILFAVITIGERPSLKELAGGALIIGTVAVLTVCTKGQK